MHHGLRGDGRPCYKVEPVLLSNPNSGLHLQETFLLGLFHIKAVIVKSKTNVRFASEAYFLPN